MSLNEQLETALRAADTPIMLETPAQVSRAAKAWGRSSVLALDTEFVRERTYYANLGLVQISDGHTVWLLDPLQPGTLPPLRDLLENPQIIKLLHSPSEDLEVLLNVAGALPQPLVDTQLACALLGQPLQLGYHAAAEWLLGITVDKDQTRSNWCARPLTAKQVRYAGLDVCVLPMMWQKMDQQLEALGRQAWLAEDCARMLSEAALSLDPNDAWRKVRGHGRLDGVALAILARLGAWREQQARKRNLPRGFVVPDVALLQIASKRMHSAEALQTVDSLHPKARQRHQAELLAMIQEVLDNGTQLPTTPVASPAQRSLLKQLRDVTADQANTLELESTLLASRRELEQLVFEPPPDKSLPGKLGGWRSQFLAEPFFEILK